MNYSLLFKPFRLIERAALEISRGRRFKKLKNTSAAGLGLGNIDSLELLEIIKNEARVQSPIIFDIGSNIGTWTLLAKAIFPDAQVHAFEPLANHIAEFNKNCSKLTAIHLHDFCVGNENTTGTINVSTFTDSSSLLEATPLEFEHFSIKKASEQAVQIKKLSDLIADKALPVPDIIKLDIQGFELEALKGLESWLNSVKYIICEVSFKEYYYGQPYFLDIANYLAQHNIQLFAFGNNAPIGLELNQIDVLFKHT